MATDPNLPPGVLLAKINDSLGAGGGEAVTIADGADVTQGAKADATWDGSAAASAISIWRYIGVKIEAMRVLLAGTLTVSGPLTDTQLRASAVPVSGTFFQATQPVSLASVPALAAGSAVVGKIGIDQTTPGTTNLVAAGQNGTWTVQPGNTANTTAWKVDGSAVTQPVSIASVPSHAVTNAGTFAVQAAVTVADGANAVEGATTGAAVTTDVNGTIQQYLRGLIKQWIAGTLVLGAGSNLIGRAAADASAATGGIPSTARLLSAAGTSGDATNVKASAGRLYAIQGANVRTSAVYLKLYNSASAPTAGSGTPVKTLYLPPSSAFAFDWPLGLTFATGVGFTLVTGSADNSSTSVTAADILALNLDYA